MPQSFGERWIDHLIRQYRSNGLSVVMFPSQFVSSVVISTIMSVLSFSFGWVNIGIFSACGVMTSLMATLFVWERREFLRRIEAKDGEIERLKKLTEKATAREESTA